MTERVTEDDVEKAKAEVFAPSHALVRENLETYKSLVKKLHPRQYPGMSTKMMAVVGYILGQRWTEPEIQWLSVTSDGAVVADSTFIGSADDFENNLERLVVAAELTDEETELLTALTSMRVDNWRVTSADTMSFKILRPKVSRKVRRRHGPGRGWHHQPRRHAAAARKGWRRRHR